MIRRLSVLLLGLFVLFFLITIKLFFWQVVSSERLSSYADRQRVSFLKIPARRGRIFASDETPLVLNTRVFLLYAEPKKIEKVTIVAQALSPLIGVDAASISAQLDQTDLFWIPVAHSLDESVKQKVKDLGIEGIGFLDESIRYYPESSMAAHLLGFVGKNSKGEDQGYFGIEGYYNEQLSGRDGVLQREADALGHPILSGDVEEIPSEDGRDLYLSLDKTIQFIAETKLREGIEKYHAHGGTVTIMDPQSGRILALAGFPSYDPSAFSAFPIGYYKNPAIASAYEPGSTFKILVLASALDSGTIHPDTIVSETGPIRIGGYTIQTWNQTYHGNISLTDVLQYSSNVGMVSIASRMGDDALLDFLDAWGFGELTGVDLQEETSIPLRLRNQWKEIDFATLSFGQGIAITPLQMIRSVAVIANGGVLLRPYVVSRIQPHGQPAIEMKPKVEREVLGKDVAREITTMMQTAVENGETKYLRPSRFRIAGKTGTAQIPIAGHYDDEKTIASFIGFGPSENPRFVMLVTVDSPTTSPWGSETAAPIFFSIVNELYPYLNISPS